MFKELMCGDTVKTDTITVNTIDGQSSALSTIIDATKYTVINFGSCT